MKRVIDIVGSALALILCSPLFLMIALAIKASSKGPVLFRQTTGWTIRSALYIPEIPVDARQQRSQRSREYVTKLIAGQAERKSSNGNG